MYGQVTDMPGARIAPSLKLTPASAPAVTPIQDTDTSEKKNSVPGQTKNAEVCPQCNSTFLNVDDLIAHCDVQHPAPPIPSEMLDERSASRKNAEVCPQCNLTFLNVDDLIAHCDERHPAPPIPSEMLEQRSALIPTMENCPQCSASFLNVEELIQHCSSAHKQVGEDFDLAMLPTPATTLTSSRAVNTTDSASNDPFAGLAEIAFASQGLHTNKVQNQVSSFQANPEESLVPIPDHTSDSSWEFISAHDACDDACSIPKEIPVQIQGSHALEAKNEVGTLDTKTAEGFQAHHAKNDVDTADTRQLR